LEDVGINSEKKHIDSIAGGSNDVEQREDYVKNFTGDRTCSLIRMVT
jgi:hypothetical protein